MRRRWLGGHTVCTSRSAHRVCDVGDLIEGVHGFSVQGMFYANKNDEGGLIEGIVAL